MNEELAPESRDEIPTLIDQQSDGRFIVAFCPVCDHTEEVPDDGCGPDGVTALCVNKIKTHIRQRHFSKPRRRPLAN